MWSHRCPGDQYGAMPAPIDEAQRPPFTHRVTNIGGVRVTVTLAGNWLGLSPEDRGRLFTIVDSVLAAERT